MLEGNFLIDNNRYTVSANIRTIIYHEAYQTTKKLYNTHFFGRDMIHIGAYSFYIMEISGEICLTCSVTKDTSLQEIKVMFQSTANYFYELYNQYRNFEKMYKALSQEESDGHTTT